MAHLIINEGGVEKELELSHFQKVTMGRSESGNALPFPNDKKLSRTHCVIFYLSKEDNYVIHDKRSTNGTMLNGNRIGADIILANNDIVTIGEISITFIDETEIVEETVVEEYKHIEEVVEKIIEEEVEELNVTETQPLPSFAETVYEEGDYTHEQISYPPETQIGEYTVVSEIKPFKYGIVYIVKNSEGEKFAMKIFKRNFEKDLEGLIMFKSEIGKAANLEYKGLVDYIAVGDFNNYAFVVMEFIMHGDLNAKIAANAPIAEKEALNIALQVAKSLNFAYKKNSSIHRNLSPAYILFDEKEDVIVTDNGLAGWISEFIADQYAIALPWYISPEQISGGIPIDWQSDQYALGVILFQMVTGSLPYQGANESDILKKQMHLKLPLPVSVNPNILLSVRTLDLLKKMTEKSLRHRYSSWEELIKSIDNIINDVDVEEEPTVLRRSKSGKKKIEVEEKGFLDKFSSVVRNKLTFKK